MELCVGLYNMVCTPYPPTPLGVVTGGVSLIRWGTLGVVRYVYAHQPAGYLRERQDHG
jgi:hypothetical protein